MTIFEKALQFCIQHPHVEVDDYNNILSFVITDRFAKFKWKNNDSSTREFAVGLDLL